MFFTKFNFAGTDGDEKFRLRGRAGMERNSAGTGGDGMNHLRGRAGMELIFAGTGGDGNENRPRADL